MAPKPRAKCQICESTESKYACPKCSILYCSVKCFKEHKNLSCTERVSGTDTRRQGDSPLPVASEDGVDSHRTANLASSEIGHPSTDLNQVIESGDQGSSSTVGKTLESTLTTAPAPEQEETPLSPERPLKPLTSLKWPYIPEEPSYPDPLKRDDPKPLNLAQYEAIATSPSIRKALSSNPSLPNLLRSIDRLRGAEREEELQRLLGISVGEGRGQFSLAGSSTSIEANRHGSRKEGKIVVDEEGMRALRELAAGVENAVRGDRKDIIGLDWEEV